MSDHPIIFSSAMIRALLGEHKTMTRRLARSNWASFGSAPKEYWDHADLSRARPMSMGGGNYLHMPCHVEKTGVCVRCDEMGWEGTAHRLWPTVNVGDRLWARETVRYDWGRAAWILAADDVGLLGVRGKTLDTPTPDRWPTGVCSSIHMPRAASRLTLIVTGVKIERLDQISEADALAEGMHRFSLPTGDVFGFDRSGTPGPMVGSTPQAAFAFLWEHLHGHGSWNASPQVVAISFAVHKLNIDALPKQEAA